MKILAKCLGWLCVICWFLLAHVSLNFLDEKPPVSIESDDGKYKVYLKSVYPINPIGIYCLFAKEWAPKCFVLYGSNGDYIGKSSPFACYWPWSDAGFIFPGEATGLDKDSFLVLDDEYYGELTISTRHKRWWSLLFGVFH